MTTLVAADYEIITNDHTESEPNDQVEKLNELNPEFVSPNETANRIVKLMQDGENVTEKDLEENNFDFDFIHEGGDSTEGELKHLAKGYWLAEFDTGPKPQSDEDTFIVYTSPDGSSDVTEHIKYGDLNWDVEKDFEGPQRAGREDRNYDVELYHQEELITDFHNIEDLSLMFTNGTSTKTFDFEAFSCQSDSCELINPQLPQGHNATYSAIISGNYDGQEGESRGSTNHVFETLPAIEGEFVELHSEDCVNGLRTCEPGAELEINYNVTTSTAENVRLELMSLDQSETWVEVESMNEEIEELYFSENVTFPSIDRTTYQDTVLIRANATSDVRETTNTHLVDYNPFRITESLSSPYERGLNSEFGFSVVRPYSGLPLRPNDIDDSTISLLDPDGEIAETMSLDDFNYIEDDGDYVTELDLGLDLKTGSYTFHVEIIDSTGHKEAEQFGLTIEELDTPFVIDDNILRLEPETTGIFETERVIENKHDENTNLTYEVNESIDDIVSLERDEDLIQLDPHEGKNIDLQIDIDQLENRSGNITFNHTDSPYQTSLELEIVPPDCLFGVDEMCSETAQNKTYQFEEIEERNETLKIQNLNQPTNATAELRGNITQQMELNRTGFVLEDSEEIMYSMEPLTPGNFTGTIEISAHDNQLEFNRVINSNVTPENMEVEITDLLDLGIIVEEAEELEESVIINNTGEMTIENIEIDSNDVNIEDPSLPEEIPPGEAETIQVTFLEITESPGFLELTLEGSEDTLNREIDLTANIVEDIRDDADELLVDIQDLESEHQNIPIDIMDDLNDARDLIDDVHLEFNDEQYNSAEDKLEDARSLYESAENELETLDQGSPEPGNGGDDEGTEPQPGTANGQEESGIGLLIPIIVGVIVFLVIGFIAYSSIELEPGDPLYDLLEK